MKILAGFYLDEGDYNKLYHLAASIIGVSGDTTLEKALSQNKIPFLQDDKYSFEPFMRTLFGICLERFPNMSAELKQDFSNYFLNNNMRLDEPKKLQEILHTNWKEMHTVWPAVIDYMRQYHNFFNHLKPFFMKHFYMPQPSEGTLIC